MGGDDAPGGEDARAAAGCAAPASIPVPFLALRRLLRAGKRGRRSLRRSGRRVRNTVRLSYRRGRAYYTLGRRQVIRARRRTKVLVRRTKVLVRKVRRERRLAVARLRRGALKAHRRIRHLALAMVRKVLKPWNRISLYRDYWAKTESIVRAWQPDLVHTCDLEGLVGGGRAARALGVPQVHDCHELFLERTLFTQLDRRVLGFCEGRAMRKADAVIVVNVSIGEELQRRYGVVATVIRNCADKVADLTVRDIRSVAGLPPDVDVILYQGGLLDGRGLREVVRSAAFFEESTRLVFLGYGSLRSSLEALALELHLDGKVHFVDAVPPDDLLPITASATIGVVPYQPVSLNNRLALPNKIFEYLAVGLPVIVSDIPELRRIVSGSGCGLTYDSYDPRALGDAVSRLLQADALAQARSAARTYGEANGWDTERGLLHRIYDRLLSVPHSASPASMEALGVCDTSQVGPGGDPAL